MAAARGIEPRLSDRQSDVLPLDHAANEWLPLAGIEPAFPS